MKQTKAQIMAGIACDSIKVIGNNTVEYTAEGIRYIRLHNTDIVTYYQDGNIGLNSGGWQTHTTRARINKYLPYGWYVRQQNFNWFVVYPNNVAIPFKDGMIINPNPQTWA